jgi:hypothetical protein
MMIYGAAGFYLSPAPPDHRKHLPLRSGLGSRADAVVLLRQPALSSPRFSQIGFRQQHMNALVAIDELRDP